MSVAAFDPSDPPPEPPAGAGEPLLWRVAQRVWGDHARIVEDLCEICAEPWPCTARRLAERGLRAAAALRMPRPGFPPWCGWWTTPLQQPP